MNLELLLNPAFRAILVKGEPGTGKTLLAFELLRMYGKGVYVSTRVPKERALAQYPGAESLFKQGKLLLAKAETEEVKTVARGARAVTEGTKFEDVRLGTATIVIESILESISKLKEPLVVLDSWDTAAKELDRVERMRTENALLAIADAKKARFVFVSEEPALTTTDYMVDAVVVLRDELYDGRRARRIEWRKLRGLDILQESSLFSLSESRFTVFSPENVSQRREEYEARPFQPLNNTATHYSTGSKDLDILLGGGVKRGATVLLELGKYIGLDWHLPMLVPFSCNFIANGGCCIIIPPMGTTPEMSLESRLRHLPRQTLESSFRVASYGEVPSKDPCLFTINPTSPTSAFQTFFDVEKKLARVGDARRPVLSIMGMDSVEMGLGEDVGNVTARGLARTKSYGDAGILLVRDSTKSKESVADMVDVSLKLDQIDGALVLYFLKPPSRIYHVTYDYSRGQPSVRLTPVT